MFLTYFFVIPKAHCRMWLYINNLPMKKFLKYFNNPFWGFIIYIGIGKIEYIGVGTTSPVVVWVVRGVSGVSGVSGIRDEL